MFSVFFFVFFCFFSSAQSVLIYFGKWNLLNKSYESRFNISL